MGLMMEYKRIQRAFFWLLSKTQVKQNVIQKKYILKFNFN
jgi:hypothetical protein